MQIKLFGIKLFEFHKDNADAWLVPSQAKVEKSKILPDFKKMGSNEGWASESLIQWTASDSSTGGAMVLTDSSLKKVETKKKEKAKLSPKRVYDLKFLNDMKFSINMDPKYVDEQIAAFKDKLSLMNDPGYNHRGFDEIGSILLRLENRKKYSSVKSVFEQFPYTTNTRIESVIKNHKHLQLGEVDQFVADMPKEATDAMKKYNEACVKLCDKKAVFYVIANQKDFKKTESRRDPILLAQSPFGHFWQIIGAWDEEMMFLEEL